MDNLLEILVPLIFAAVYFIGNMLSNRPEKKADEQRRGEGGPAPDGAPGESGDMEDQARRIREEIRRKIAERRGEAPEPEPQPAEPTIFAETRSPVEEAPRESEVWYEAEEEPEPAFAWEEQEPAFEDAMQARLQQIEEMKRKAEALRAQAKTDPDTAVGAGAGSSLPSAAFAAGPVRTQLLDTSNARAAFIYAEVFGPPASLREPGPRIPAQQKIAG